MKYTRQDFGAIQQTSAEVTMIESLATKYNESKNVLTQTVLELMFGKGIRQLGITPAFLGTIAGLGGSYVFFGWAMQKFKERPTRILALVVGAFILRMIAQGKDPTNTKQLLAEVPTDIAKKISQNGMMAGFR